MKSAGEKKMASADISALVRREILSGAAGEQLRKLPVFQTDRRLPHKLDELIGRLERCEKGRK